MARTKRSAKLDNRTSRLKLKAGVRHQSPLEPGQYLAYRRPMSHAAGSWLARWNDPETNSEAQARIGTADDYSEADGEKVFDYAQAQAKARDWFDQRREEVRLAREGVTRKRGPFTVADAMEAYFQDAVRRGVKGADRDKQRSDVWIVPVLGPTEVSALTRNRIEKWLDALAKAPRRMRSKKFNPSNPSPAPKPRNFKKPRKVRKAEPAPPGPPRTEDEKRARKDSANRVLTTLKAALNFAMDRNMVKHGEAWQAVKPYRDTTSARIRFLSPEEQVRLVNACPPDFRRLVQGALYSGARYGELCRLRVEDFNGSAGTLFIELSKSGKPRHIVLTEEAQAFFTSLTAGRPAGALVFTRDGVERRKHTELAEGWGKSEQARFMAEACKISKVDEASFHELRHTYASGLVNAGLPMAYVAAQLGHSDTRVTEKHYGHLAPTALAEAVRKLAPKLGLGVAPKVAILKIAGSVKES